MTPHLVAAELKVWVALAGFAAGLAGMALERRWLVWIAVALLGVAFLLRLLDRRRPDA